MILHLKNRLVIYMLNGTAAPSVLGQVVKRDAANRTYVAVGAGENQAMGVVGLAGIAVGSYVPIVVSGLAQVLLASDKTAAAGGANFVFLTVDNVEDGRAAGCTYAGGTFAQGIGSALDTATAGALVWTSVFFSKTNDVVVSPPE